MKITYYAANETMGETPSQQCEAYRAWALAQLRAEYPTHEVSVLDAPSIEQSVTDDEDRLDEIADFCSRLWDRCPWDWL